MADIDTLYTSFEPEKVDNHAITSAHSALWRLVQQKLTERPIKAYEPFCSLNSAFPTTAGAEDILDQGSAELEEDILDGIVDDGHALIDTAPQELNDAIPHTPTNQEVPLITKSINRHKITSFLPHVKQDGAATPERPTPEPLTPEAPTPMTLALTATSDMLITETRNELFLGPPRMDRELKILRHTNESSVTLGLADVVEDFDSLHTPDTPQSEAYGYLELSGEMEFDGLLQETHSSSKDQMTDTESDAFDHAVIVPEPISVR